MTDNHISKKNRSIGLTAVSILYFAGVLAGTVLYNLPEQEQIEPLKMLAENFVSGRLDRSFAENVINSFCGPFIMLLVCFILGFSAIAQPVEVLAPVFQGMGTGISLAGIYDIYGLKGIGMAAVLIIPGAVISAFAVIIAAREALNMSSDIYSVTFGRNGAGGAIDFRLYFTKYVILCAVIVVAAFAEGALTFLLAYLWTA